MSHIFISYSRKDLDFAQKIVGALSANKLDVWIDWNSIPKGEDWEQEIYSGIEEADAFLFLISQDSVVSEMCNKEIAHAVKNGKRILPIFISNVEDKEVYSITGKLIDKVPREEINRRNFIFCREERDDFKKAIEETRKTIHTDYEWLKYHTRLQVKALEWERRKDAKDTSRLLRGKELREAELRLAEVSSQTDPQPTILQEIYIQTSRENEERQRRRVILGLGIGFLILTMVSIFAWRQRISSLAEANLRATAQAEAAQQARISLSRKLAAGAQTVLSGHPQESLLLSIEALNALNPGDPSIPNGEQSIRDALLQVGGHALGQGITPGVAPVISADNHWLATGSSDGTIKLWDLTASDPVNPMLISTAQENLIQAITITADSRWLIAASSETKIQLWNLTDFRSDKEPIELSVDGCPVYILKASPNNHWLVIICNNDSEMVWDLAAHDPAVPPVTLQRKEVSTSTGIFDPGIGLLVGDREQLISISADSRWLARACNNYALLWDLKSPGLSAQPAVLGGYKFPVTALTYSQDSKWLAVADAKTILLWNLAGSDPTASPIIITDHFQLSTIAFNTDGSLLAAGNSDGLVRLWDLTTPDPADAYFDVAGQASSVQAIGFSRDNHWMITAGMDVRLLDISSTVFNSTPLILEGYENPVSVIKVSLDSRWLVTLDNDTALRLWDLLSPQPYASPITLWGHSGYGSIRALATGPTVNHWLATAGGNGVALWDLTIPDFQTSPILLSDKNVNNLAISPDNRWLAAGNQDGSTFLWDLNALKTDMGFLVLNGHTQGVNALAFSADSQWLATGSQDGSVRLWDLASANPKEKSTILGTQSGGINKVSFSPDGRWLVAVGSQGTHLWDVTGADSTKYSSFRIGKENLVENAVFSTDGHWLAIGADDTRLLDLTSPNPEIVSTFIGLGTPVALSPGDLWLVALKDDLPQLLNLGDLSSEPIPLFGHEGRVTGISFSSDGHRLITGSWDDTVRIWDLRSNDPGASAVILHSPEGWLPHINALAVTPDDRWLITGTEGGSVYLWTLQREELVYLACRTAGRNLYQTEWDQYFTGERQKTCAQWP